MEENKKSMSEKLSLPVSIIIAGLLIAGGIYMNGRVTKINPTVTQKQQIASQNLGDTMRPIDANDHILGSSKARVLVVEYSDTECPFCKVFHATMNTIMQEYGKDGEVAWVYRHFPIEQLHSKAFKESQATECAAQLGGNSKFWEYINKVYELTPSNDGLDPKELTNIATGVGLSSTPFNTCLESGEFDAKIKADMQNALELDAGGTPYSLVVDTKKNEFYPIKGAYPYAQVKQAIDLILKS